MTKDTIFSPSFGNRPRLLLGRDAIIQAFLDGLQTEPGNRERAVLLRGQRGSGKTVLLWEIADRARELGYVVANPTVASHNMLDRILEKIQDDADRYLKKRTTHVAGGSVGALGFSAGLQFSHEVQESKSFQYKLTQICRKLGEMNRGVLILVDELQANSAEIRQLVVAYQELIGERQDIALIMAGLPGAVSATLAMLSTQDVRFLAAMAEDEGPSKMSEIADRLNVTPDYAQKYRKRLIDSGVVEAVARGLVQFAVPYLDDKLRNDIELFSQSKSSPWKLT